jgi:hypothetical protein
MLRSTARRYNNLYSELERLKKVTGFNKPFPILNLPRELRDQIYTYSLRATLAVDFIPGPDCIHPTEHLHLPPTPGLLQVNRQIFHEAIDILYSTNIFRFGNASQLFAFQQEIGPENCDRVRKLRIWISAKLDDIVNYEPSLEPSQPNVYDQSMSEWAAALKTCSFRNIVHLEVDADYISRPITKDLQDAIEELLGRPVNKRVPHLALRGFDGEQSRDRFPQKWKVVEGHWDYGGWEEEEWDEVRFQ